MEILDQEFRPLPGLSGEDALPLRQGGLRQHVTWAGHAAVPPLDGPFRLKLTVAGIRPEDVKLYAVYLS